jgi:hypothetical protein
VVVQVLDRVVEDLDPVQMQPAHQRVMAGEPAGQGHRQVGHLPGGAQPGLRQVRHQASSAFPADQRLDHRRRRVPGNIADHRAELDAGRLQRFLQPPDL